MRSSPAPLSVVPAAPAPALAAAPAPSADARAAGVSWPAPGGPAVTGRELADRLARFHAAYPAGRVLTELVTRAREVVVFRAAVYRAATDPAPAATGWAASGWSVGPGFERAEEAALGRALAHLGFAPGLEGGGERTGERTGVATPSGAGPVADPARRALVTDLGVLVARAERYGLRPARAATWRARLRAGAGSTAALQEAERRLRAWVERRRAEPYAGAL